ncbi:uncharacterized protein LOC128964344 [Oppia nitens]|uniref:uncharacterized protein LOC128964344 n=1 Tax=Oppia nitens TaxID=1686743 RepID=UPI0023DA4D2F|nr:uncharacterized protein LOC128964344 [Oppia nitens]
MNIIEKNVKNTKTLINKIINKNINNSSLSTLPSIPILITSPSKLISSTPSLITPSPTITSLLPTTDCTTKIETNTRQTPDNIDRQMKVKQFLVDINKTTENKTLVEYIDTFFDNLLPNIPQYGCNEMFEWLGLTKTGTKLCKTLTYGPFVSYTIWTNWWDRSQCGDCMIKLDKCINQMKTFINN